MKVTLIWPNYRGFHEGVPPGEPTDAFWIECTPEEAETKVGPLAMSIPEWHQQKIDRWRARGHPEFCFLVTRDLRVVIPFWWSYPIDNL